MQAQWEVAGLQPVLKSINNQESIYIYFKWKTEWLSELQIKYLEWILVVTLHMTLCQKWGFVVCFFVFGGFEGGI